MTQKPLSLDDAMIVTVDGCRWTLTNLWFITKC